jgi:hypothetical protein
VEQPDLLAVSELSVTSPTGVVALSAALAVSLCGCAAAQRSSEHRGVSPAADFVDVFKADLAGDERRLALAVAGQATNQPPGDQTVHVYERGRLTPWSRAPGLAEPLGPGSPLSLVRIRHRTCVGYESVRHARVLSCLSHARWRPLPLAGLEPQAGRVVEFFARGGSFVAVLRRRDRLLFFRLGTHRWSRIGPALNVTGAIPGVGLGTGNRGPIDVVRVGAVDGRRSVSSLWRGRWRTDLPLTGAGAGPVLGGPVRLGTRLYLPVVDATTRPWRMSAYARDADGWSLAAGPLNRGAGNAQGLLSLSAGSVWAAWQEHGPMSGGLFRTRIYAQLVAPVVGAVRRVWAGRSIGPGSVEVVQGAGRRWVLYMPAARAHRALTVAVKPL